MSFSTSKQLEILIKGNPSPSFSLKDLVHQLSVNMVTARAGQEIPFIIIEGVYSLPSPLDALPFTSEQLALCYSYQEKMKAISQKIVSGSDSFLNQVTKVILSFIGDDENIAFEDLEGVADSVWETHLNTHLVGTLELLALTTSSEVLTYKSLIEAIA